jgi:hypothetical protein
MAQTILKARSSWLIIHSVCHMRLTKTCKNILSFLKTFLSLHYLLVGRNPVTC